MGIVIVKSNDPSVSGRVAATSCTLLASCRTIFPKSETSTCNNARSLTRPAVLDIDAAKPLGDVLRHETVVTSSNAERIVKKQNLTAPKANCII